MTMIDYSIGNALDKFYTDGITGNLIDNITYYPYEETTPVTLTFSNDAVVSCLESYRSFTTDFIIPYNNKNALEVLKYNFDKFMLFHGERIKRICYALTVQYCPIENVDEKTENTTTHSGSDVNTLVNGARTSSSYNDASNIPTSDGYVNTFDSATPVLVSESKDTGKTHTETTSVTDSSTLAHGHVEELDIRRRGNIGVTTNAQLISQELTLARCFNILDVIIADFISMKYYLHNNYEGV